MANTFVRGNIGTSAGATSATITLPGTPAVGDLLVIIEVTPSGSVLTPSDSQGNMWMKAAGIFNSEFGAYYAISNGNAGAYTATVNWTSVAGTKYFTIGEWSNPLGFVLDTSAYVDQCLPCGFGVVIFTANEAGALGVVYSFGQNNGDAFVSGTGFAQRETGASNLQALGDKLSTANGSNVWGNGQPACPCLTATFWAVSLVFKPAPSTAPNSVLFDSTNL